MQNDELAEAKRVAKNGKDCTNEAIPQLSGPILSKADKRRMKKPEEVLTAAMKERNREELQQLRRRQRILKSNGGRKKMRKEMLKVDGKMPKRTRQQMEAETQEDEDGVPTLVPNEDDDEAPQKKRRRLEGKQPNRAAPKAMAKKSSW